MELRKILYGDVSRSEWDEWVAKNPETSYGHSSYWLEHLKKFTGFVQDFSFCLVDGSGEPVAICPLAVSMNGNQEGKTISFSSVPFSVPAIACQNHRDRKKILDRIVQEIQAIVVEHNIVSMHMQRYPLNRVAPFGRKDGWFSYFFEWLRYRMLYEVENAVFIDLRLSDEDLAKGVGKYQMRHIKRGVKKGLTVRTFDRNSDAEEMQKIFDRFEQAHILSAGRMTRPQATWDSMLDILKDGDATLFVVYLGDIPISYLYCGEFQGMAFGWSQVNDDAYEKKYSPRHLLEWNAILHYKKAGFFFYEVGERYFSSQLFHTPTAKELTISLFKERYGGVMLPKIKWYGYFQQEAMKSAVSDRMRGFLDHLAPFPFEKTDETVE